MKWRELRVALNKKLTVQRVEGAKHPFWYVYDGDAVVAEVMDVKGEGEMRNHEIGNVARGMSLSEHQLKRFVSCEISGDRYLEIVR